MTKSISQLTNKKMKKITQATSIDRLSLDEIVTFFTKDLKDSDIPMRHFVHFDPRSGEPVIVNPKRAHRPKRYPDGQDIDKEMPCPICAGKTTGILDIAALGEGYSFINKNLYPVVTPDHGNGSQRPGNNTSANDRPTNNIIGLHFLQWTNTIHDRDWHNMPIEDCVVAMERLAVLERLLIESPKNALTLKKRSNKSSNLEKWSVSIIKNVGKQVGGSLPHGHQQIVLSNVLPRRILEHVRFEQKHGETFTSFMLAQTPEDLIIREYETAVLIVPFFMRRPFDMMLVLKNTGRKYCHQMDSHEIHSIAQGWHDGTLAINKIMPKINRELAYNVITHNGPGAGLYFEFLPYTQETGGLEQLGLISCQADPYESAKFLRSLL
jgi:galactose-1-phosphate uridylyltransferase